MSIDPRDLKMVKSFYHETKANYDKTVSTTRTVEEMLSAEALCSSRMEALLLHVFSLCEQEEMQLPKAN